MRRFFEPAAVFVDCNGTNFGTADFLFAGGAVVAGAGFVAAGAGFVAAGAGFVVAVVAALAGFVASPSFVFVAVVGAGVDADCVCRSPICLKVKRRMSFMAITVSRLLSSTCFTSTPINESRPRSFSDMSGLMLLTSETPADKNQTT